MLKILVTILTILAYLFINWLINCLVIYIICLCFGFTFTWKVATGIWLLIIMLRKLLKNR